MSTFDIVFQFETVFAAFVLNVSLGSQWAFLWEALSRAHHARNPLAPLDCFFPSLSTMTTIDTYCWDISVGKKSFHNGEPENEIEFHERNELFSSYLLWWEKIMKRQYLLLLEHEEWHHHETEIKVKSKEGWVKKDVEIFQSSKRRHFVSREGSWWWAWKEEEEDNSEYQHELLFYSIFFLRFSFCCKIVMMRMIRMWKPNCRNLDESHCRNIISSAHHIPRQTDKWNSHGLKWRRTFQPSKTNHVCREVKSKLFYLYSH